MNKTPRSSSANGERPSSSTRQQPPLPPGAPRATEQPEYASSTGIAVWLGLALLAVLAAGFFM